MREMTPQEAELFAPDKVQHEKIEPGLHSMSGERYFAAEGVSKSMLDILAEKTPLHLQSWLRGEWEDSTPATDFGTIAHRALLEPDTFLNAFHVRPEGMKFNTKKGIAWRDEHTDKPIISTDDQRRIENIVRSTWNHPFAKRLLHGGVGEQTIFVVDAHGTLRKSRLDALTKGNVLPDIKICDSALQLEDFERRITRYRYHVQAAYYLDNCRLLGMDKQTWFFILAEKNPPYSVRCMQLLPEVIEYGRKLYQRDLQVYRNCVESDSWPGWEDSYVDVGLTSYEMKIAAEYA
jgi:exodeoxyribonuclease VIII